MTLMNVQRPDMLKRTGLHSALLSELRHLGRVAAAHEFCDFCRANNVLKHAPHTAKEVMSDTWDRPYDREQAAFPAAWVRQAKFWPTVSRVDNVYGDRFLVAKLPEQDTPDIAEPLVASVGN